MDKFIIKNDDMLEDGLFIGFDKGKYGDYSALCVEKKYFNGTIEILKIFKNEEAEYLHNVLIGKEKLILENKGE